MICLLVLISCGEPSKPVGMSPRIFRNTPAWNAVKAIMKDDTCKLDIELRKNPNLKTLVDPYYGYTILQTAILNNKIKATEKLLRFGFDPNSIDDSLNLTKSNAVIHAVKFNSISPKILELVLKYGGNPNSFQEYQVYDGEIVPFNRSAITFASILNVEKVRILLKYGADINPPLGMSPLDMASILNIETLLCLLEHGADFNTKFPIINYTNGNLGRDTLGFETVTDRLRYFVFPLDSRKYQCKLKVIEFLKERGLDYSKTEIPSRVLEEIKNKYPETWKEYIKVY